MTNTITFRGGESTGGVADRKIETAKQESTGSVGARKNQESIFTVDNELKQDTVCFRANPYQEQKKETSALGIITGTAVGVALTVGLLGLAHKYDVVSKYIKNEKAQKFFRHTDTVTKPCHEACTWVKKNCYDKIINMFKK